MTRRQAEDLIAGTELRLCIRYYRRRDGSILTQDCPVGLQRLKQRMSRIRRAVTASLLGFFTGASRSYAVNGFKTAMSEPVVVGMVAVRDVDGEPEMGDAIVGNYVVKPPVRHPVASRKRARR